MTDITITAAISNHRFILQRQSFSNVGIGTSIDAIARLLGDAFSLTYLDPFTSRRGQPVIADDNLEGRDPNW
jgi:hypothetical protein